MPPGQRLPDHRATAGRDFNRSFEAFDRPGRFVFLPGYEWSGNTALGGDRNVIFPEAGRTIRRSCHALVEALDDEGTDALDARALHAALRAEGAPVLCIPHVGGRYANLHYAHDRLLERAVEVHSDWGTFDWLLDDALRDRRAGRHRRQLGRAQGAAGRLPSRRVAIRILWRPDLPAGGGSVARRHLRRAAQAASLRHHQRRAGACRRLWCGSRPRPRCMWTIRRWAALRTGPPRRR